ncbi:unnamed protein product [Rhizophagus irregularis]|nr:unnamed protein product [Rhizophagus irregularis]
MSKSKWFCLKKNSDNASIQSSISSSTSNKTLALIFVFVLDCTELWGLILALPRLYFTAEDVLGGLNAAVTQMNWQNNTRVLLHIGDYPPHGRRFSYLKDNYPNGDPYGLTAEDVLGRMQQIIILYFFGKITNHTDKMLEIFHDIIGEFPVFDLVGGDPLVLINKFIQATSSSTHLCCSLTSTIVSSSNEINSMQRKKIIMNPNVPDWNTLSLQKGIVMWYHIPKTLDELKNPKYFDKSNLISKNFSYKVASQPIFFRVLKNTPYFALDAKE